jgi:hypothetical protein
MNIVISFRKNWMIFSIGVILLTALILGIFSFFLSRIAGLFLAPFFFALLIFYVSPWLWRIFHALFLHQPALIIDSTGIHIFPLNIPKRFFMSWSEIQEISVGQYKPDKYFCLYPKESQAYAARFSPFERLMIRLWKPNRLPVTSLPLVSLDQTMVEIFQQIQFEFAREIQEYDIQLHH